MALAIYIAVVALSVIAAIATAILFLMWRRHMPGKVAEPTIVYCMACLLFGALLWSIWDESFRHERTVTCHITGKKYDKDAEANAYTTAECGRLLGGGVFFRGGLRDPKVAVGGTYQLRIVGSKPRILRVKQKL